MAPARDWAGACTFALCHKTLDTVGTIHFCMVILKHTSYSGHRGTSLSRFSILGGIIIHWCIFSSFCGTTEDVVGADWIKGLSISAAHLFCPHFLVFPPRRKLCPGVLNNISTNETKWIWMLVTDVLAGVAVTTQSKCIWAYVDLKLQVACSQTPNLIVHEGIITWFL